MSRCKSVQGIRDASIFVQALDYCIPFMLHHLGEDDHFIQLCCIEEKEFSTRTLGYTPTGRFPVPRMTHQKVIKIDDEGVGTWMGGVEVLIWQELLKGRFLET